jgi:hypothetical protein
MFIIKTRPLTRFLQENVPKPMKDETSEHAFKKFKLVLQIAPILPTSDWNKPFLIYYDAFGEVVGSTLS